MATTFQLTTYQRLVLEAFANAGVPSSRYELFRNDAIAQGNAAIARLVELGLLEDAGTCDEHWARRFRVTATGRSALGRPPKPAANGKRMRRLT